jgi:hypothetical protein
MMKTDPFSSTNLSEPSTTTSVSPGPRAASERPASQHLPANASPHAYTWITPRAPPTHTPEPARTTHGPPSLAAESSSSARRVYPPVPPRALEPSRAPAPPRAPAPSRASAPSRAPAPSCAPVPPTTPAAAPAPANANAAYAAQLHTHTAALLEPTRAALVGALDALRDHVQAAYAGAARATEVELARIDGALHARVRKYRATAATERRAREAAEARAEAAEARAEAAETRAKAAGVRVSALSARAGILEDRFTQAQAQARDAVQREQQARADAADLRARAGTLEMKIALLVDRCAALAAERDGARAGSGSGAACAEPVPPALVAEFRHAVAQDWEARMLGGPPSAYLIRSRRLREHTVMEELERERNKRASLETANAALTAELAALRQPTPTPARIKAESALDSSRMPKRELAVSPPRPPAPMAIDLTDEPGEQLFADGSAAAAMPWPEPARLYNDIAPNADGAAPVRVKHERDELDDRVLKRQRLDDALAVQVQAPAPTTFNVKQEATYDLGGEDLDEASVLVYPDSPGEFSPQAADEAPYAQPTSPALGPPTPPPQGSAPPLPSPVQAPAQDAPPRLSIKHLPLVYQDVGGHFRCRLCMCVSRHRPVFFVPSDTDARQIGP